MAEALREGGNANVWCLLFLARWYQVEMSMCEYERQMSKLNSTSLHNR